MKKRILSMLLTLLMLVSAIPINVMAANPSTPSAQAFNSVTENTNQADGIVLRKGVTPHLVNTVPDGTLDIILEAYTTGVVRHTTTTVPTDIVLVLDMSGSMTQSSNNSTLTATSYVPTFAQSVTRYAYIFFSYTTYGFSNRQTTYYIQLDGQYIPVSYAGSDDNDYDFYSYYNSNNQLIYVYPALGDGVSANRANSSYAVVQFYNEYERGDNVTALQALKIAVHSFIETTHQKNAEIAASLPNATANDLHRISLVKFADNSYAGGSASTTEGNTTGYSQVVKGMTVVNADGAQKLNSAMDSMQANGATAVDYGLNLAEMVLDQQSSDGRNKVVIVFSDGSPTHSNGFETDVANAAIAKAEDIKFKGAKIYSISVAPGADVADTTGNTNRFFHYISSNYPSATSMTNAGLNGNASAGYYMIPSASSSLTALFESIAQAIEAPTITMGTTSQLVDTVSPYFTIPAGAGKITVQTADRTAAGGWDAPAALTGTTPVVSGQTVQIQGFNFDDSFISDVPRTKGSNNAYYGTKLILTINVTPNYDYIDSNPTADGVFYSNTGTANLLDSNGQRIATVDSPAIQANRVTYQYTVNDGAATVHATRYRFPGAAVTQVALPSVEGHTTTGWTLTSPASLPVSGNSFTMPASDVVFTADFTPNKHDVTYKITGATPAGVSIPSNYNQTDVAFGTSVTIADPLTAAGFTFTGWQTDGLPVTNNQFTMPDRDVELTGYFTPASGVKYTVIHYTQDLNNLNNYTRYGDPIEGTGTTGETVTATLLDIPGFTEATVTGATVTGETGTFATKLSGQIAADGSLVLRVFYTRNRYSVTYAYDALQPSGAPDAPIDSATYYHGQTVDILGHDEQSAFPNYDFAGWHTAAGVTPTVGDNNTTFVMPIGGLTLYGTFKLDSDVQFKVEHYLQGTDGSYPATANYTDTSHGVAGTTVTHTNFIRTGIEGHRFDANVPGSKLSGKIDEADMLVLKLYYPRNQHNVTYAFVNLPAGMTPPAIPSDYHQTDVMYGTEVTVKNPIEVNGYAFTGWRIESPTTTVIESGKFDMPDADVKIVGTYIANSNTRYTVEHYWQNANDDGYQLHESLPYGGTTGERIDVQTTHQSHIQNYTGFTFNPGVTDSVLSGTIDGSGSLVLKLYYDRKTYGVVYQYEEGAPAGAADLLPTGNTSYRYGQTVKVEDPVKLANYTFIGWYSKQNGAITPTIKEFEMPIPYNNKYVTLYGDFQRKTGITYTVEHYLQDSVGSTNYTEQTTARETHTNGVAGATATAVPKAFPGYTYNAGKSTASAVIKEDGTTVLQLYYDLVEYTVTYVIDGFNPGADLPAQQTAIYNATVNVALDLSYTGYTFTGWHTAAGVTPAVTDDTATFSMPAANVTLHGSFSKYPTYDVEYWLQSPDNLSTYIKDEANSHTHSAPVGTIVSDDAGNLHVRSYSGYTHVQTTDSVERGIVPATGKLVLKIYYNLLPYTVTYKLEGDIPAGTTTPAALTNQYVNTSVTTASMTVPAGYTFEGWKSNELTTSPVTPGTAFTMPAHNVTLVGTFKAGDANYSVEHYLMNDQGNYQGVTPHTETKSGRVGENVRATSHQPYLDLGAQIDMTTTQQENAYSGTIKADNSLVLKIYYSREPESLVEYRYYGYDNGGYPTEWPALPTDPNTYYVGQTVNVAAAPTLANHRFEGWYSGSPSMHAAPGTTFNMPRLSNDPQATPTLILYGRWVSDTYTVRYFVDGVERTDLAQKLDVGRSFTVAPKLADTAEVTYSAWSAPEVITPGVTLVQTQDGYTLSAAGEVHIKCQSSAQTYTVRYYIDGVEQTAWAETHNVNATATLRAKVADTADRTYSAWSVVGAPAAALSAAGSTFTMTAPGTVTISCTSQAVIIPTYTVTYYIDGRIYQQFTLEAGYQHILLGEPPMALGQFFTGWSAPRTVSGAIVSLFSIGNGQQAFTMPAADVVIHANTTWMPINDGALKIKKVVEAPDSFTGGNVYTFNIYRLENNVKKLVHIEHIIINPATGKGESGFIELPKGTNYIVEEVGANVPGFTLDTVLTSEYGAVIQPDQPIRVTMKLDPTVITCTNTYAEIPLETTDHFGYIIGYPDGTVQPEGNITRAEVATIFFRLLTDDKRAEYWSQTNSFTDVAPDAWYNNAISTLANAGILEGYGDNTYRPGNAITRAELVKIAMSFYGSLDSSSEAFNDTGDHWASAFINAAAELGFINGYGDGTFQPNRPVTRAEAMKIINRTLDRKPDKNHLLPDMIIWVDNADPEVWYYAEVQEATNSHTYTDGGLHEIWETILPIRNWAELEKAWSDAYDGKN